MSHERVVEKRGKTYGPYLYESYRDENGKVKKRYLGKVEETTKSYKAVIGFLVLALIVCLLIIGNWSLTGRATLSVDEVGVENGTLTGNVLFVLQQSEMIPADTQVTITHGDFQQTYSLNDLILETPIEGDYFIPGKEISGRGLGYSTDSERFPIVNFVLGIYAPKGGSSYTLPENETPSIPEETEEENETQPEENQTEETGTRTISGNSIRTFFTGRAIDESQYELVDEISTSVRYNESFVYDLDDDETADIVSSEQDVDLNINDNQAIVTTDYLGDDLKALEIDIEALNITAFNGDLIISFVYNGIEIDSATTEITIEAPSEVLNETANETNETNITLPRFGIQVDNLSYVILNASAGKNQTTENLTVYTDQDTNSSLKLIRNWYRNGTSITLLNMPFEGGSNSTWTRDYSPYAKNGIVTMNVTGSWNNSSGQDEYGAYSFNSAANSVYHYWNNTTTSGAPTIRYEHTAVWTGDRMILWGGVNTAGTKTNTGSRYDPINNLWNATTTTGAPSARNLHTAVWTGDRMIVWGGYNNSGHTFTGGIYNPYNNTWTATNNTNAPIARTLHTAVWTGDRMIVWGGEDSGLTVTNTGGVYDFATNTWTDTNLTNAPDARKYHTAIWTGTKMIVWGGLDASSTKLATGGIYDSVTNTWTNMTNTGAPSQRYWHSAIWTGTEMIIWGGQSTALENTGKRYNPITNTWGATTSTTNAPDGRYGHYGTYVNGEMIIWGGWVSGDANDGGHYNVATNTWTATNNTSAPIGRTQFTGLTTKDSIIVWGGYNGGLAQALNTGGRYYINAQDGASVSVNNFSLNPQGTISAWIKPGNASSSNAQGIVTNYYTSTSQGLGVELRNNDITFIVRNSTAGGCNITTTSDVIQNNNWYHVVGMWNSSTCALYVNAQPNGTATASSSFDIIGEDLRIGAYNFFETNFFNGTIDDVLIFNETLSEEQISELYANGTRTIVSNETEIGETWKACVTANDLSSDSNETCSNNLTIFNSSALCGTNISSDTILVGNLSCQGTALTIITNNTILDCNGSYIFGNSSGIGVNTYGTQNLTIKNCWIENFNKGVGSSITAGAVGVYLYNENIINNTLFNNTYGLSQVTQCNITGNNISGGLRGIDISSSPAGGSNLVTSNRIFNNSQYGIYMFDPSNNNIYNNYFNNPSVNLYTSSSGSNNNFNATYNCSIPGYVNIFGGICQGGNYWSNYTGVDDGSGSYPYNISGDGIGDTNIPYNSSMNGFGDYLPLANSPPSIQQLFVNSSSGNNLSSDNLNCYVNATDSNGDNISYYGYWYRNGAQNYSFNTSPTSYYSGDLVAVSILLSGNTSIGDKWSCNVSAYDGMASTYLMSDNLTIADDTAPLFSNASNVSINFKKYSNFTANITIDNYDLDYYVFSTNASSSWSNITVDITGAQHNASQQANISVAGGGLVCWYYWANDTAGNNATSTTYCFNVNNTAPYFNPDLANQTAAENSTLYYDINCSDIDDNDILTYYINDSSKFTIGSTDGLIQWTPGFDDAGLYTYTIACGDGTANVSQVFNINVTDMNRAPEIISLFVNSTSENNVTIDNLTCWANATDDDLDNVSYSGYWYLNGAQNYSFNTSPTSYYSGTLVNVATLLSGNTSIGDEWSCNVSAYDGENYSDYNISNNLTISAGVGLLNVTLISPENFNATNASSTLFNCSANGTGLINLTLRVWNSTDLIYSNTSNVTGSYNSSTFNASNLTYGILEWNCHAYSSITDVFAENNNTLIYYTNLTNIPSIYLINPENSSIKVQNNVTFIYEAYSVILSDLNCTLVIDNESVSDSLNVNGRDTFYYNVSDGNHTWRVLCIDNESNAGTSLEYEFTVNTSITDSTSPVVDLQFPTNNKIFYALSPINITFLYNASDDYGDLFCTFYSNISGSWQANENHTNYPVGNEEWISFTYENNISTNNTYIWNVRCNDSSGNNAFDSGNFTFILVEPGECECSNCADCQARLMDLSCLNVSVTADFNYSGTGVCIDKSKVINQESISFNGNGHVINGVDGDGTGILFGGGGLVDIFMVIDTSGSMLSDGKLDSAKSAARAFVDEVGGNYSIGLVEFDSDSSVVVNLTTNHTLVKNGISSLSYDGGRTGIGLGIINATDNYNLTNPNRTRIMVLLSDGKNNEPTNNSSALPIPAAYYAAENNVTIYSIAYGGDADRDLMNNIATITGGEYFFSPSNETIRQTYQDILNSFVNIVNHEVKNLTVQSFRTCINLTKTYYSEINNATLYNCSNVSLSMFESEQDKIQDFNIFDTGNTGVSLRTAPNNNFTLGFVNNTGTGDGFFVYYSNNTRFENIGVYYGDDDGFYIQSNATVFDNVTSSSNLDIGIELYRSYNNTLNDLTLENNNNAIKLAYSNSSNFSNVFVNNTTAGSGTNYGIYLRDYSERNNFTNITVLNGEYGFYLTYADWNIFDNITSNNNSYRGFYTDAYADNLTLSNFVANNNSYDGIYMQSNNNNLTNITANYNGIAFGYSGVKIDGHYNRINNVTANYNGDYGLFALGNLSTVQNVIANYNNDTGLRTSSQNSLNVSNVITNNNGVYGAQLGGVSSRINNISASYNPTGIYISSYNSVYTNCSAINNTDYSYYVDAPLFAFSNCRNTIKTDNVGGVDGKPFLYVNDTTSYIVGNSSDYSEIEFCNVNNSRIDNVTISNPGATSDGILLISSQNINITNSNISNAYQGVYLLTYYSSTTAYNISNNTFDNVDTNGVRLSGNSNALRANISRNNLSNLADGIYLSGIGTAPTYDYNRLINISNIGIRCTDSEQIKNNYLENANIGVSFGTSGSNLVESNTFFNGTYAVYSSSAFSGGAYIRNNSIENQTVGVKLSPDPCDGLDYSNCINHEYCAWSGSYCEYGGSFLCSDSSDGDSDSFIDCSDSDCTYISPCGTKPANYIYWNNFTNNTLHADSFISGDEYNTTVSSEAQGNFWDDAYTMDIYDTNRNIWGDAGSDLPYSYYLGGNVNNSVYDYGPIVQALSVYVNDIQCEINTNGNWSNCSNASYDNNITRVRVNCTDTGAQIINASFILKNVPDNYTFFNVSNATEISGDWWIYNNADVFIRDGGEWNLSAVCINNNSQSEGNYTNWTLAWGTLSGVLITNHSNVTQNEFFNFSAQVTCVGGECGNVTSIADPESATSILLGQRQIQDSCEYTYCYLTNYYYEDWAYFCPLTGFCDYDEEACNANCGGSSCTWDDSCFGWSGGFSCSLDSECYWTGEECYSACAENCNDLVVYSLSDNYFEFTNGPCTANISTSFVKFTTGSHSNECYVIGDYSSSCWDEGYPCIAIDSEYASVSDTFNIYESEETCCTGGAGGECPSEDTDGDGVPDNSDTLGGNATDSISLGVSNLTLKINGTYNNSPYGINNVSFFDGEILLVQFDWNFNTSNVLNMSLINITKTSTGIYIQGANVSKTIYIPVGAARGVCIKNTDGVVVNAQWCNGSNEIFLEDENCNGSSVIINGDSVTCAISGGNYVLSGLTHSGGEAQTKGVIPMNSGTPFYTTSQNPDNTTCSAMYKGDVCNVTWSVNATGNATGNSTWKFYAIFNATQYSGVGNNTTGIINITITEGNSLSNITQIFVNSTYGTNLTNESLFCWANATDDDLDNLSYSGYWYLNGGQNISFSAGNFTQGELVLISELLSGNTSAGENWSCNASAYDGTDYSDYLMSENLTVLDDPGYAILNSSVEGNTTTENLTVYTNHDSNASLKLIRTWQINNSSLMLLNMPFEGGSLSGNTTGVFNATQDYVSGNNGTAINAIWNSTGGYDGKGAYNFSAAGRYIYFNPINFSSNDKWSVSFWAKKAADGTAGRVIGYNGDIYNFIYITSSAVTFTNNAGTTITFVNFNPDTAWHFYTINARGVAVDLYVDGEYKDTKAASTGTEFKINSIGRGHSSGTNDFVGLADDVIVWNRTLKPSQIKSLYDNRTDLIVSSETNVGEIWESEVTSNNGVSDITMQISNELEILSGDSFEFNYAILNSSLGINTTNENISAYVSYNESVNLTYSWYVNNTSVFLLNMPFNTEANPVRDYSANNFQSDIYGTAFWMPVGGYDGKGAYNFSLAGSYLNFSTIEFSSNDKWSVSLWAKKAADGTAGRVMGYNGDIYNFIYITASAVTLTNNTGTTITFANFNPDTAWHFYTITANGSSAMLYVDGEYKDTKAIATTFKINSIGRGHSSGTNDFVGLADDVIVWNRSLSTEQISVLWNNRTDLIVSQETLPGEVWKYEVTPSDGISNGETRTSNELTIQDVTKMNLTIIQPENNTDTNETEINFTVEIVGEVELKSATFNIYNETGLYNQTTINISGANSVNASIVVSMVKGVYHWFLNASDITDSVNSTLDAYGNYTLIIDDSFIDYSDCYQADKNYGYNDSTPNPHYVLVGVETHGDEVDWVKVCRLKRDMTFNLTNCYRRDRNYGHSDGPINENYVGIGFETHGDEVDWFHVCNIPGVIANLSSCYSADRNYGFNDSSPATDFAVIGAETHGDEVDWIKVCQLIYSSDIVSSTFVHLLSPSDGYNNLETNLSEINVTLNCSATSGYNLSNITVYVWNWTGDLIYTNTTNVSGKDNFSANVFNPPALGGYSWNCLAESTNDSAWSLANNSMSFGPGPDIEFVEPTTLSGEEVEILIVNVSASEEQLETIVVSVYYSDGVLVDSFESNESIFYLEIDRLDNGFYYFNATAYSTIGTQNSTETRNVTVNKPYWGCQVINTSNIILNIYSDVLSDLNDSVDSNTCRWNYTNATPGNFGCIAYPPNVSDPNVLITYFKSCYTINASNVTINCRGYNVTGDGDIDYGVDLSPFVGTASAFSEFTLKNCTIENFGYGILSSHSNNTTIFNNTFNYNDDDSIYVYNASNLNILNNTILNSGWTFSGDGIQIYNSNNLSILYNYIYNDSWNSMYIFNLNNSNISYNHINISSANGLFINRGVSLNILNNTIEETDLDGMSLTSVNDSNISENILLNIGDNGIIINKCNNSEFRNNTLLDIASYGIEVLDSNFAKLINNIINNTDYGAGLYGFYDSEFSENLINNSASWGVDTYYMYDSIIANNSVYSSGYDGIWVYEVYDSIFTNNSILNSTDSGIIVEYSEDNNFTLNYFGNNALGFEVSNSVDNLFNSNILQDNAGAITFTSSYNNSIYNNIFNNSASVSDNGNNIWNTSYTSEEGLNILGEPYLGGNYWGDYNGTDDGSGSAYPWNIAGDGIGDTNLPWKGISSIDNGGDWLPLVQGGELQNAIPVIQEIFVNSTSGTNYTNEDLECYVNATDADNGNLSYSGYWYMNGVQNLSFSTGNFTQGSLALVSTLLSGNTTAGQNWSCNASAYDGENYSSYVMSENLTILAFTDNCSVYFNETSPLTYPVSFIVYTNCSSAYTLYRNGTSIVNGSEQALGAGTYNFTVIRTDNINYANIYDEENFVIQQVTGEVYAYLNASRSNITTDKGTYINLSAVLNTGSGSIKLYKNGTLINQGMGEIYNYSLFDSPGIYNISAVYDGNENYTADIETWYVNVTSSAIVCGNGIVETGESCDLTNLSGESCVTRGYTGGSLSCTASCTFNTSACTSGGGDGGCTNQCSPSGEEEEECVNSTYSRIRDCGNYDSDSCLEWSDWNITYCGLGLCQNNTCVGTCVEDWNCSGWSSCYQEIQTRTCIDLNNCGTENNKPEEQRSCYCLEDWDCEWTICSEGEIYSYAYDCVDLNNCGTEYDKPNSILCSERESDLDRYGCNVRWNCSDWGICEIDLRFSYLFKDDSVQEGVQKRYCIDEFGCADDKEEKRACDARIDIRTSKTTWCEENYVEVYEKSTNKLVSRVKEDEKIGFIDLGRINIDFLSTEFTGYCDYCYDGIKDYDETDVDCGGPSCPECIAESDFFNWLYWLLIFLWASIIIFTTTIVSEERQFIMMLWREAQRKKAEEGLLKGIERMAYYQTPNIYPQIIKKSKSPKIKIADLVRKTERTPSYGLKSERGINVARHGIESKYNLRDVASYKEQQKSKKEWGIARKLRELFSGKSDQTVSKPEKFRQLFKPGNANAGKNISETKGKLSGRGF